MYIDDNAKFGFTFIEKYVVQKPQYVIFHVVLSNDIPLTEPTRTTFNLRTSDAKRNLKKKFVK